MNRILILAMTIGLLGTFSVQAQDTLTVMSYNIYHGEQAYEDGKSSLNDVAKLINEVKPDFVALQEVDSLTERTAKINDGTPFDLMERLAQLTGMHNYFGKAIDYGGGGYGLGILARQALQFQKVRLPSPRGGEPRILLYVEGQTPSGTSIVFGGTHLCHLHSENRLAQIAKINKSLLNTDRPALVAGDFNFTPDSESYARMSEEWIDAAKAFTREPELTFPGRNPTKRIDYLFLSESSRWTVLDVQILEVEYSDHRPIVATVILESEN